MNAIFILEAALFVCAFIGWIGALRRKDKHSWSWLIAMAILAVLAWLSWIGY